MHFPLVEISTIATIFFSSFTILWLLETRAGDSVEALLNQFLFWSLIIFVFLIAPWAFLSYYLRYLMIGICALVSVFTLARVKGLPLFAHRGSLLNGLKLFILSTFILLNIIIGKGGFYEEKGVELSFPLKGGRYYVLQGGDNPITNFFHRVSSVQRYAIDIVKLNSAGRRAKSISLYPGDLSKYEVFGEAIYAPCDGVVVTTVDGIPDLAPPLKDMNNPAGNHIELECSRVEVLMAHMMNGSVKVATGQHVKNGDAVGRVGNSGNTTEPHLHIHAVRSENEETVPLPILFGRRLLTINSVFEN